MFSWSPVTPSTWCEHFEGFQGFHIKEAAYLNIPVFIFHDDDIGHDMIHIDDSTIMMTLSHVLYSPNPQNAQNVNKHRGQVLLGCVAVWLGIALHGIAGYGIVLSGLV